MPTSPNDLLKLILDSKALSIWNHKTGPVFWYILGVPGPFYLNTELMIGRELSATLLDKITAIIAKEPDPKSRAAELEAVIMAAYRDHKRLSHGDSGDGRTGQNRIPEGQLFGHLGRRKTRLAVLHSGGR